MGLDMNLYAERYLWSFRQDSDDKMISENVGQLLGLPANKEVKTIRVDAGYWRKANHIHGWFVSNVQQGNDDCGSYAVGRESLKELRDTCKAVLDDNDRAAELLPTQEGFFFGGTDYGNWYLEDIVDTIRIIDEALDMPGEWDFTYSSSW